METFIKSLPLDSSRIYRIARQLRCNAILHSSLFFCPLRLIWTRSFDNRRNSDRARFTSHLGIVFLQKIERKKEGKQEETVFDGKGDVKATTVASADPLKRR